MAKWDGNTDGRVGGGGGTLLQKLATAKNEGLVFFSKKAGTESNRQKESRGTPTLPSARAPPLGTVSVSSITSNHIVLFFLQMACGEGGIHLRSSEATTRRHMAGKTMPTPAKISHQQQARTTCPQALLRVSHTQNVHPAERWQRSTHTNKSTGRECTRTITV